MQFGNQRLNQRGDGKSIVDPRLCIAYPHFQGVKKRMEPDIPPNFLGVVDAACFHQQLAVIVVLGERLEGIGNAGAWKTLEHF